MYLLLLLASWQNIRCFVSHTFWTVSGCFAWVCLLKMFVEWLNWTCLTYSGALIVSYSLGVYVCVCVWAHINNIQIRLFEVMCTQVAKSAITVFGYLSFCSSQSPSQISLHSCPSLKQRASSFANILARFLCVLVYTRAEREIQKECIVYQLNLLMYAFSVYRFVCIGIDVVVSIYKACVRFALHFLSPKHSNQNLFDFRRN